MRYYKIIYFLIGLFYCFESVEAGEISGNVTIPINKPLANVILVLNPSLAIARTNSAGFYQFNNIPAGDYEILICSDWTVPQKHQIIVDSSHLNYDISLTPGDLDRNGSINLIDAALFTDRFGATTADDFLDLNSDQNITEQDLNLWYDSGWQMQGHWYNHKLLDDGEHDDPFLFFPPQGKWQTHHDNGSSTTVPAPNATIYPSTGGYYSEKAYQFQYKLGSAAQYPFALIRLLFGANENVILDAQQYETVSFTIKGEAQPLIISLKAAVTSDDWCEYYLRIPLVAENWQSFTFNFREQFQQPDWGGRETMEDVLRTLQAIQFKADDTSIDQTFTIRIDNIYLTEKLYNPPSGTITGQLTCDQSPLPAVIITLSNSVKTYRLLSSLDGTFEFTDVEEGDYLLSTFRPGYIDDSTYVSVTGNDFISLNNIEIQRTKQIPKPLSLGPVKVINRDLLTDFDGNGNYSSFFINGVGYAPTPIGSWGDLIYPEKVYNRDMPLLQEMNCNAIRTWGEANALLLDKAEEYGIKVLAGFWVSTTADFYNPVDRLSIINGFKQYVSEYKDFPAILAWSIGNEQNYVNGDNWAWYSLVEDLAVIAYEIEGEFYHPVATPNGDRYRIGFADFLTRDSDIPYLDIWGMNIYKPDSEGFAQTFLIYSAFSEKPLWISEYGIDAYDNRIHNEYEIEQAEYAKNRLLEMSNSSVCIGSTLMAYSDEWWKAGDPSSHDPGGYSTNAHPDGYSNEEWWGIFRVQKNNNDVDILTKRAIYDTLQVYFSNK